MLIVANDAGRTEVEFAAGELACPDCDGELRPSSHARPRWLRTSDAVRQSVGAVQLCQGRIQLGGIDAKFVTEDPPKLRR